MGWELWDFVLIELLPAVPGRAGSQRGRFGGRTHPVTAISRICPAMTDGGLGRCFDRDGEKGRRQGQEEREDLAGDSHGGMSGGSARKPQNGLSTRNLFSRQIRGGYRRIYLAFTREIGARPCRGRRRSRIGGLPTRYRYGRGQRPLTCRRRKEARRPPPAGRASPG